jgi:MerR family transcriptional regulator/heat shock protein HspR
MGTGTGLGTGGTGGDRRGAVYVISVAAEIAGVHPQTLRIYERKGLLEPARTRGGSRRYSEEDLQRLGRIAELTEQGLNLAGVKRVLALEAEVERLNAELDRVSRDADTAVRAAHREHRRDLVPLRQTLVRFGHGLR